MDRLTGYRKTTLTEKNNLYLQKHRFPLIIDDAEPAVHLAVRAQAPNLVQLEGWSHRFRDIDRYLRAKGYGEEAINYFKVRGHFYIM